MKLSEIIIAALALSSLSFADEAPTGAPVSPTSEEQSALNALQEK